MIGVNRFELNQLTMREAIAEYLNKRATSTAQVEVTNVVQPGTNNFEVLVKPLEAAKEGK